MMHNAPRRTILAACAYFLVLCSYYTLRPVRDDMAVQFGADRIQWLFSGTLFLTLLLVPLFGWAVKRLPRRKVLPVAYGFIIVNLMAFVAAFTFESSAWIGGAFFVWLSVINLFLVSVFWSRMGDTFSKTDAQRHYGAIAAGGTAGALAGPALTIVLAARLDTAGLLTWSAILLACAVLCIVAIAPANTLDNDAQHEAIGGGIVAGIALAARTPQLRRIALLVVLYTTVSTVLYIELIDLAGKRYADAGERKAFFASLDLLVNALALATQLFGTRRIVRHAGLRIGLVAAPALVLVGLGMLGAWRTAMSVAAVQVVHRAGEYALSKPGREMLWTTIDAESRYKGKNFIDTAVYRASDAAGGWLIAFLRSAGLDTVLIMAVPVVLLWIVTAFKTGAIHDATGLDRSP